MSPRNKLVAAVLAGCLFLLAVLAAAGIVLGAGHEGAARTVLQQVLLDRLGALLMVAFVACVFLALLLRGLHDFFVLAPARVAEEAATLAEQPAGRLAPQGSGELRALIGHVNRLAEQRQMAEVDVEARIRNANAAAEADRNRFAVLMAELAQGVIVCSPDGRVLLYNRRARVLFAGATGQGMAALGLGRSIYGLFDRHLIGYALDAIEQRQGHRHFVAASESGRLLRVLIAPIHETETTADIEAAAPRRLSGYMAMIEDMTEAYDGESTRDRLLHDLTERSRGPVANLRVAAEMLQTYCDMGAEDRARFLAVVHAESEALARRIEAAAKEVSAILKARWPLEEMLATDLLLAARRWIADRCPLEVGIDAGDAEVWLKVDGFSLLQAMSYLAVRLSDEYGIRRLTLRAGRDKDMAWLDMIWSGAFMSTETVMQWELDPMNSGGEATPLTVRDVVERNGGEVWFQRDHAAYRAYFRFLLPAASGAAAPRAADIDSRPAFYDFDLFRDEEAGVELEDRLLAQLTYTVFDTETTGLEPSEGDEIIQIGAVRIVNRRILREESYEQLVDPRRPLPAKSVKIHGIRPEVLVGQPPIGQVLPQFRAFVADTVLVAHNAAFDMRFLELKEAATGVRFDRPVLDTFLLSAVLFPSQDSHRLEAIAERVGVSVFGRHTAVGDAIVTAEVFLKLLPLLAEKGIHTLGEARAASEKTFNARISY